MTWKSACGTPSSRGVKLTIHNLPSREVWRASELCANHPSKHTIDRCSSPSHHTPVSQRVPRRWLHLPHLYHYALNRKRGAVSPYCSLALPSRPPLPSRRSVESSVMAAHAPLVGVVSWCVLDEEKEGRRYAFSLPLASFVSFVSQESAARERCVAAVSDERIAVRHGRCASVCSAIFFTSLIRLQWYLLHILKKKQIHWEKNDTPWRTKWLKVQKANGVFRW